jgi:dATP pyrophosphohydrolase
MPQIVSKVIELLVFRFREDRVEVLLLQRNEEEALHPGMWQIITGTIAEGETAQETARRELTEETGLEALRFWSVPYVSTFYDPEADAIHCSPFFAVQVAETAQLRLSQEHRQALWLPVAEGRRRLVWPSHREGLDRTLGYILSGEEAGMRSLL